MSITRTTAIDRFIRQHNVQPADVIVVRRESFALVDHFVVYLGYDSRGRHIFIANMIGGVQFLDEQKVENEFQNYQPTRIRRFLGTPYQRQAAVQRAISKHNKESYSLILNNCEHFANYVQEGKSWSKQSNVAVGAGISILAIALLIALLSGGGKGGGGRSA